jgi:hypothetical protein
MCAITGAFKCRSDLTYIEEIGYVSPYLCQYSNSLDRHLLKSESFYSYDVNDYIYIDMDRNPKSIREIIKKKKFIRKFKYVENFLRWVEWIDNLWAV